MGPNNSPRETTNRPSEPPTRLRTQVLSYSYFLPHGVHERQEEDGEGERQEARAEGGSLAAVVRAVRALVGPADFAYVKGSEAGGVYDRRLEVFWVEDRTLLSTPTASRFFRGGGGSAEGQTKEKWENYVHQINERLTE